MCTCERFPREKAQARSVVLYFLPLYPTSVFNFTLFFWRHLLLVSFTMGPGSVSDFWF